MTADKRKRASRSPSPNPEPRDPIVIDMRPARKTDLKGCRSVVVRPNVITVDLRSGKDGKRRYTGILERPQIMERRVTKGAQIMVSAVSSGLDTWVNERNKSSRRRRDGAIVDFPRNAVKAWGRFVRKSTKAPLAVVRNFRNVRSIPLPPFVFLR